MRYLFGSLGLRQSMPKYRKFEAMPDSLLFFLFVTSSLPALYWGHIVVSLTPPYIETVNQMGFNLAGIVITVVMLFLAINSWFFGCIAKRTGGLIYERLFK